MRTQKVVVLPYDGAWRLDFEEIKRDIEGAIGDLMIGIEHVGSTSVEGMSAKPIIDIDVIIQDYTAFDAVVRRLEAIGYVHEGNLGIKDREAFKCSNKPHLQQHHLYVCPEQSEPPPLYEARRTLLPSRFEKNHSRKSPGCWRGIRICGTGKISAKQQS